MTNLTFDDVIKAHERIKNYTKNTAILSDENLNKELGAQVFFKMENQQITNSFKARGAFNAVLSYKEKHGNFPQKIVVQSSGNHAQAIAYVCKTFGLEALIYMITSASPVKINAAKSLGAQVMLLEKRSKVNAAAEQKQQEGYVFIHPSANEEVICGQGTSAFEALSEIGEVDAVFTPCGGGGLASGTFLATKHLAPKAKVFTCEPAAANDVAISLRQGKIFHFEETPNTIADGARTLATSELCFNFLKQHDGLFEISENEIIEWRKKLENIFQQKIEPTSCLTIAGVARYLKENPEKKNQKILAIISGGNVN